MPAGLLIGLYRLISPTLYERSTLMIDFNFQIKVDFWYTFQILDFTGLNIYITFICTKNFSSA